jgi:integrase
VSGLADSTAVKISGVLNAIEEHINPQHVRDLTSARIDQLKAALRKIGRAESTINSHLAHLKAALHSAVCWGMIPKVPDVGKIVRAKRSKVMKGRPITTEEFERMIAKVAAVVGDDLETVDSWKYYLRGLWWSGLRLEESLELSWDDETKPRVDLTAKRPVFLIRSEHEKGNKDRELPMAPEFAEFLSRTPEDERRGYVFNPKAQKRRGDRLTKDRVSRIGGDIGEKAGVIVEHRPDGSVKYASAHDLRRSFGQRWAYRINCQALMILMRHETIDTTMKFYVGQDAQSVAEVLWSAVGTTLGTTSDETEPARQ